MPYAIIKYFIIWREIMAIKLIVDTTCDMAPNELPDYVTMLPVKVYFDSEEYIPFVNLTIEEFYDKLSKAKELPHTSQVNSQTFVDVVKPMLDNGDDVLILTISSELSGTYNSAKIAKRELNTDRIAVVDSKLVTFAYRALIYEAMRLIESGMPLNEIESSLNGIKEKVKLLAVIDDLKYLRLGGRIGAAGKVLGDLFAIKPIITFKNGIIHAVSKTMGIKKGIQTICDLVKSANVDMTRPRILGHSNCLERCQELRDKLNEITNIQVEEITAIGASVGTHAGPGCTGIVYFEA